MKKLRKKVQAEDFIADLIPSLIIIAIGLYVLSNMHSVSKAMVDERGERLQSVLKGEQKTIADYLSEKVSIDGKEISLWELISLSYKNEKYQRKIVEKLELVKPELLVEFMAETPEQEMVEYIAGEEKECLAAEIHYPDQSKLEFGSGCEGKEKTISLPTYEGQHITVKFTQGVMFK